MKNMFTGVFTVAAIVLLVWAVPYAYESRGYLAAGGEWFFVFLPAIGHLIDAELAEHRRN